METMPAARVAPSPEVVVPRRAPVGTTARVGPPYQVEECAVCLNLAPLLTTSCNHKFCEECLGKYVNSLTATPPEQPRRPGSGYYSEPRGLHAPPPVAAMQLETVPCPLCRQALPTGELRRRRHEPLWCKGGNFEHAREERDAGLRAALCCAMCSVSFGSVSSASPSGRAVPSRWRYGCFSRGVHVRHGRDGVYDKWAHNYDYTDGLHYAEISIITGPAALIFLWLLSTALLKSISEHLKRHDRATWDTAMDGANLRSRAAPPTRGSVPRAAAAASPIVYSAQSTKAQTSTACASRSSRRRMAGGVRSSMSTRSS